MLLDKVKTNKNIKSIIQNIDDILTKIINFNTISFMNDDLYFGGKFIKNIYHQDTLNHIGYLSLQMLGVSNPLSSLSLISNLALRTLSFIG